MKNVCAARVVHNIQHTQHYCLCLLCMYRLCTLRVCSTWYVYTHDRVVPGNNTGPVRTQLLSNTQTVLVLVQVVIYHTPSTHLGANVNLLVIYSGTPAYMYVCTWYRPCYACSIDWGPFGWKTSLPPSLLLFHFHMCVPPGHIFASDSGIFSYMINSNVCFQRLHSCSGLYVCWMLNVLCHVVKTQRLIGCEPWVHLFTTTCSASALLMYNWKDVSFHFFFFTFLPLPAADVPFAFCAALLASFNALYCAA